jgi:Cu/Ag efflux protein CusF
MKPICLSVVAALVIAAPLASAQSTKSSSVTTAPGSVKTVQMTKATATVTAIDMATRTVSLKRSDGSVIDVHAGDEVKNLDKVKVGDRVTAEYTQALSLDLKKGGTGAPKRVESPATVDRAATGAPSATVGTKTTVLADVVVVNSKKKLVTVRGPEGHMVDLKVNDPEQLKNIKAGDQVEAVYTQAKAISVQPASDSAGK